MFSPAIVLNLSVDEHLFFLLVSTINTAFKEIDQEIFTKSFSVSLAFSRVSFNLQSAHRKDCFCRFFIHSPRFCRTEISASSENLLKQLFQPL